jgi:hypothetical protein
MQIVNWRTHLKFPEEAKLSLEVKDLMSRLLCNVDQRLGTRGADEIKVLLPFCYFCNIILMPSIHGFLIINFNCRYIHGFGELIGTDSMKWRLHMFLRSMMTWTLKILRNLTRYENLLSFALSL